MAESVLAVVADLLIDGTGRDPVEGAVVVVEDGRISAAGPRSAVTIPHGARVIEGERWTVMPGVIDCHVHLAGSSGIDFERMLMERRTFQLLHAVPNCLATLRAGVTTVRDAGLTPASVRDAVAAGFFPGPRMEVAVTILGQTGGHADDLMPCGSRLPMDVGIDVPHGVVDGADQVRQRVREVMQAGADWIKLCTSGGVLSSGDMPEHAQMTVEEIAAAVGEAASHGKRVMSHAMSAAGVRNAVEAGVASIEHGCLLDEEAVELMVARGAWLVPTLVAPEDVVAGPESGRSIPIEMVRKAERVIVHHRESFRMAVEKGVRVAMGTDAAVGPHGANLRELARMATYGMTPLQAITAATGGSAALLQREQEIGGLQPGMRADLLCIAGDPVSDISLFEEPGNVRLVLKDGIPVRDESGTAVPVA